MFLDQPGDYSIMVYIRLASLLAILLSASIVFFVGRSFAGVTPGLSISHQKIDDKGTQTALLINVLDFDAIGDGVADDTTALRESLLVASVAGGGTVLLPANRTFVSGPLNLTSHVYLQVEGTLQALTWTTTDWPIIPPLASYGYSEDGPVTQYQAFLYSRGSHDVKISGSGVIDGNGVPWWEAFKTDQSVLQGGRPNLIQMVHCRDIEISGVTFKDSPFWCLHPVLSTNIHIHHIKIRSPMYSPNSDGIDPDSCRNVMIEHNDVSCGDDHIAIKAGRCGGSAPLTCNTVDAFTNGTYETVNVTVRNNIFRIGMGIALGSECSGGIRDVIVENNLMGVCQPGHCEEECCGWSMGLHLKSADTRGGHMKNIFFRNNTIYNTSAVILLEHDYQQKPDDHTILNPTRFQNISFQGNKGGGTATSIMFRCSESVPCENVTFLHNDFDTHASIECRNVQVLDENGKDVCHKTFSNSAINSSNIT